MGGKRRGVDGRDGRWRSRNRGSKRRKEKERNLSAVHPTISARVTALSSSLNLPFTPAEPRTGPMFSLQFATATTSPAMKAWSWHITSITLLMLTTPLIPQVEWDL